MATNKQIQAVKYQQSIGLISDTVDATKLSTKEASLALEKSGYKNGTVSKVTVPAVASESKPDVEGIRFGLAQKLVSQHYSHFGLKFWACDKFDNDVHKAYDALVQSEQTYGARE